MRGYDCCYHVGHTFGTKRIGSQSRACETEMAIASTMPHARHERMSNEFGDAQTNTPHLAVSSQKMPPAEHGGEHRVRELREGRARDGDYALAAHVEVDNVLRSRIVVGHDCGVALKFGPVGHYG